MTAPNLWLRLLILSPYRWLLFTAVGWLPDACGRGGELADDVVAVVNQYEFDQFPDLVFPGSSGQFLPG